MLRINRVLILFQIDISSQNTAGNIFKSAFQVMAGEGMGRFFRLGIVRNGNIAAALQGVDDIHKGFSRKFGPHHADNDQHDNTDGSIDSQEKV